MASYTASPNFTTGGQPVIQVYSQGLIADLAAVDIGSIATVITPTSGKTLRLLGGLISLSADASVLFEDNASGAANYVYRLPLLAAKTPCTFFIGNGKKLSGADRVLKATSSASATITGVLFYSNE